MISTSKRRGTFAGRALDNSGHCAGGFGISTIKLYHNIILGTFEQGERET